MTSSVLLFINPLWNRESCIRLLLKLHKFVIPEILENKLISSSTCNGNWLSIFYPLLYQCNTDHCIHSGLTYMYMYIIYCTIHSKVLKFISIDHSTFVYNAIWAYFVISLITDLNETLICLYILFNISLQYIWKCMHRLVLKLIIYGARMQFDVFGYLALSKDSTMFSSDFISKLDMFSIKIDLYTVY